MNRSDPFQDEQLLAATIFPGDSEMAKLMRAHDWSKTRLGPIEGWPSSLKTMLGVMLGSRFPMLVWWGAEMLHLYNDAYRPILRDKHPASLAAPAAQVWAEIWDVAGPMARSVLDGGPATWTEDLQLFINSGEMLEETYFTFSYSPIPDDDGRVGGVLNTVRETTATVLGERQLRMLHDLSARAVGAASEADAYRISAEVISENELDIPFALLYQLDGQGQSAKLAGVSGWKEYDGPAKPAVALIDSDGEGPQWPLLQVLRTGREVVVDDLTRLFGRLPFDRRDQGPRRAVVLPLTRASQTEPDGFLIAGISPHRKFDDRYERFFRATAQQVTSGLINARVSQEERQRTESLSELDRVKTEFFANVSHELRTPLTLILAPLEVALTPGDEEFISVKRRLLSAAHNNSIRLLQMVNSLLDFSKLSAGRVEVMREPVDLVDLTRSLCSDFREIMLAKRLEGSFHCDVSSRIVGMDRYLYERILFNLLSNAVKFTPNGGRIGVELSFVSGPPGSSARDGVFELSVTDTGIGISEHDAKALFRRFGQVEGSSTRRFEGTGLGLSLVKEFSTLLGGEVRLESEPGKGSRFTITAPAPASDLATPEVEAGSRMRHYDVADVEDDSINESSPEDISNETRSVHSLPKLLLAEDNRELSRFMAELLSPFCRVRTVSDGAEALKLARSWSPDLILSDVMMPRMDGLALTREIKSDPGTANIPVVLLTAMTGREALLRGWEAGADDYLFKPFHPKELEARVKSFFSLVQWRRKSERELERREALEQFSHIASHDLKEPLRKITTYASLLNERLRERSDPEERDWIESVLTGSARMFSLIDNLVRYSQLDLDEGTLEVVDLDQLAGDSVSFLDAEIAEYGAEVLISNLPRLTVIPGLIEGVFRNLLGNALKFRDDSRKPIIRVEALRKRTEWQFSVRDNGVGFDPKYAESIFILFRRLHGRERYPGDGMGLTLCKKIIERHGGRMWAESVQGEGSAFHFTLPEL